MPWRNGHSSPHQAFCCFVWPTTDPVHRLQPEPALGPDEWLVVTPAGEQAKLLAELQQALDGVFASAVDNSSGLTMLHVTGDNAADLLATDCPFDLHPREFKPGQCAQTRLAKAGMTISPLADGTGFEVIIRRSFADYLLLWLQDAAIAFE